MLLCSFDICTFFERLLRASIGVEGGRATVSGLRDAGYRVVVLLGNRINANQAMALDMDVNDTRRRKQRKNVNISCNRLPLSAPAPSQYTWQVGSAASLSSSTQP